MKNITLVPNAPILIESTRSIGYSFETALADIIDNSIAKNARRIDVNFDSADNPYVAVLDNGDGMDYYELKDAMRYGSQSSLEERAKNDLGRFGLGMKTASLSQCRKLTVFSKKDNNLVGATWDLDYIIEKNEWSLIIYSNSECMDNSFCEMLNNYENGTLVVWENFDRIQNTTSNFRTTFDKKIEIARQHISLVFHRYLSDEIPKQKINIYFNGNKVISRDPFLLGNPATQPLAEQTILINDEVIKVKPFILPYISKLKKSDLENLGEDLSDLRRTQGFYIYRNRRLIVWGTWFKLIKNQELNKLARVRVDIPNSLDSIWNIDIKKSSASLPDSIKKNLVNIVLNAVGKSERVYKYRGRKISSEDITHVWEVIDDRGKYKYTINRSLPLYKDLLNHLDEVGESYLSSFIKMLENSFPFEDIYYRMGKNEIDVQKNTLKFEEVYEIAVDMIHSIKGTDIVVSDFIDALNYYDFFSNYPEVIEKLKENYQNE